MSRFLKGVGCVCATKKAPYAMRLNTRQIRWRYVHTSSRPACLSQELHTFSPPAHFFTGIAHFLTTRILLTGIAICQRTSACVSIRIHLWPGYMPQELQSFSPPTHFLTTRMLFSGIADFTQMTKLYTLSRSLYDKPDTRTRSHDSHSFSRLPCLQMTKLHTLFARSKV